MSKAAKTAAKTIRLPPIRVRVSSPAAPSATEDKLPKITSVSITTEVVLDGKGSEPSWVSMRFGDKIEVREVVASA